MSIFSALRQALELRELIDTLESFVQDPSKGLPEELFLFVSRITPLVNVDLLIKNEQNHTLLTWRDDAYYHGWHIPGGIIRHKETIAERIKAVAKYELGAEVQFNPVQLTINEMFNKTRDTRGHFISLLYQCTLVTQPDENLRCKSIISPNPNEWMWHGSCPASIIPQHEMYRKFIGAEH